MSDISNGEMIRWLDRIEHKVDKAFNDHETRLRRAERVMYVAIGLALAGASSGIASVITQVGGAG